jgi:hypothetical protein
MKFKSSHHYHEFTNIRESWAIFFLNVADFTEENYGLIFSEFSIVLIIFGLK